MTSNRVLWIVGTLLVAGLLLLAPLFLIGPPNPVVVIETSMGEIRVELFRSKAPLSVDNFLRYVDNKFYDNTVVHDVSGIEIHIAGANADGRIAGKLLPPVKNEADNGLKNERGTLAMVFDPGEPDSARSGFIINVKSNSARDQPAREEWEKLSERLRTVRAGSAVFGKVIDGMDVVDRISRVEAIPDPDNPGRRLPESTVVIKSIRLAK